MKLFKIDDSVMFSREFLRSTGQFTGPVPFAKGRVVSVEQLNPKLFIVAVNWGDNVKSRVLSSNLIHGSDRSKELF
jgi:hypothetical protein